MGRPLEAADWMDGRGAAGPLSTEVKRAQLHFANPVAMRLGQLVLGRLERHPLFVSATLPHSILPPLFNRYGEGEYYGPTWTEPSVPSTARRTASGPTCRRPCSSPRPRPTTAGAGDPGHLRSAVGQAPAGHLALYPGASVHHVTPVTRGLSLAAFFWVQSLVRADADRSLLFDMDTAIQQMPRQSEAERLRVTPLSNVYHNLLRRWADL